jgi:hypothetical protein
MSLGRSSKQDCLSDLRLDQWSHGELTAEEAAAAERHIAQCARCQARRAQLVEQAQQFARRRPQLEVLLSRTEDTARSDVRARWRRWSALGALAAAAALLLVIGRDLGTFRVHTGTSPDARARTDAATRRKGGARLGFHVRRGSAVFEGQPGEVVHPGDALRFTVSSPSPTHVTVLSVDGAGIISVYHPQTPSPDRTVSGSLEPLSTAVELDEALGTETIYGVFCERPVSPTEVRAALARDPEHPLFPATCQFERFTIVKEKP